MGPGYEDLKDQRPSVSTIVEYPVEYPGKRIRITSSSDGGECTRMRADLQMQIGVA